MAIGIIPEVLVPRLLVGIAIGISSKRRDAAIVNRNALGESW